MTSRAYYTKPVDVLTDEGWRTLDSIKEAAEFIGVSAYTLSSALFHDEPICGGRQIRLHQEGGVS